MTRNPFVCILESIRRLVCGVCGESRRATMFGNMEEGDLVVPFHDWKIKTVLKGQFTDGNFVAEVVNRRRIRARYGSRGGGRRSYILKCYDGQASVLGEFLVMSRIGVANPYLLMPMEWFIDGHRHFFVYEYEDTDFLTVLRQPSFKGFRRARHHLRSFAQALQAVRFLHEHEIVHYDLKFENMVINLKTRRLRLIDFEFCSDWCAHKQIKGTVSYMSPEIYLPKEIPNYDPGKQDVWSLGMLIMCMVVRTFDTLPSNITVVKDYEDWLSRCLPKHHFLESALRIQPNERCDIHDLILLYHDHVLAPLVVESS